MSTIGGAGFRSYLSLMDTERIATNEKFKLLEWTVRLICSDGIRFRFWSARDRDRMALV